MSDSDDDLLALAEVGGSDEEVLHDESGLDEHESERVDVANPYPLENKYKDTADRAALLELPEIEREEILYERAQEVQRYEERKYLAQRRARMARPADEDGAPSAKRQRGTTGVSSGTKSGLEALKKRRAEQQRRSGRRGVSDDDSESDPSASDDDSDASARAASEVEWDSPSDSEAETNVTLSDINRLRWGKTLFARYAQYPEFESSVTGCFVRVNIGVDRHRQPVYRLCIVRKVVKHKPYSFLNRTVDEAIVAAMGKSERTIVFSICSDSAVSQDEFDYWSQTMRDAKLPLPTRRRAEAKFGEIRALSKRVLTSAEIDALVARRAELNGVRGAGAVLVKADLVQQRERAVADGDSETVQAIDARLAQYSLNESEPSQKQDSATVLQRVNERNRRANVETVRRAEIQHNAERRRAGTAAKADPFSRLRTTAKIFYRADMELPSEKTDGVEAEAAEAAQLATDRPVDSLAVMDDLIASLDVKLEIVI